MIVYRDYRRTSDVDETLMIEDNFVAVKFGESTTGLGKKDSRTAVGKQGTGGPSGEAGTASMSPSHDH